MVVESTFNYFKTDKIAKFALRFFNNIYKTYIIKKPYSNIKK
jgi:hypothetical protein